MIEFVHHVQFPIWLKPDKVARKGTRSNQLTRSLILLLDSGLSNYYVS